jgi:hypothetical protein
LGCADKEGNIEGKEQLDEGRYTAITSSNNNNNNNNNNNCLFVRLFDGIMTMLLIIVII